MGSIHNLPARTAAVATAEAATAEQNLSEDTIVSALSKILALEWGLLKRLETSA
jgi:hypothetical protein